MTTPELRRRLVAILAADAVGYTRLMSVDDGATVRALEAAREVFRTHICAQGGRVIDTAGDSVLAVFESAAAAVLAAQALQQQLGADLGGVAVDRRLQFRIGIHSGDVIEKADGTVYGDGVNIAARLQTLAEPGGITVSQAIYDAVRGRVQASFADMGEQAVKNIAQPVRVYCLDTGVPPSPKRSSILLERDKRARGAMAMVTVVVGLLIAVANYWNIRQTTNLAPAPATPSSQPASITSPLSIVVLPFSNLTGDAALSRLADGLTASTTADLIRIPGAFVVNAGTAFSFKDKVASPQQVGKDLRVRFVLLGSLQRNGSKVRVSAQLADTASNELLWADVYDDENGDQLALQDRVTRRILKSASLEFRVGCRAPAQAGRTRKQLAYLNGHCGAEHGRAVLRRVSSAPPQAA